MKPNLIYYKLFIYIIHKTIILLINLKTSNNQMITPILILHIKKLWQLSNNYHDYVTYFIIYFLIIFIL
jgi:hypothetical protein